MAMADGAVCCACRDWAEASYLGAGSGAVLGGGGMYVEVDGPATLMVTCNSGREGVVGGVEREAGDETERTSIAFATEYFSREATRVEGMSQCGARWAMSSGSVTRRL